MRALRKALRPANRRIRRLQIQRLEPRMLLAGNIFDDALGAGWQIFGWDSIRNPDNSAPTFEGSKSVEVTFEAGWGGVIFNSTQHRPVEPGDEISFAIHGGTGSQPVAVLVIDQDEEWQLAETVTPPANSWQTVTVDLSQVENLQAISGFAVQEFSGSPTSTVYLDSVNLTEPPIDGDGQPGQLVHSIYAEELSSEWQDWSWSTVTEHSSTVLANSGQFSIAATYQSPWAGVYFDPVEDQATTQFNQIELSLHGGAGGQQVRIYALDSDGAPLDAFTGTLAANQWSRHIIDLDALGDPSTITGLIIQNQNGPTDVPFYIDDVALTYRERVSTRAGDGPEIVVDPGQLGGEIHAEIYGLNFADDSLAAEIGLPVERWGGNSTSRYNFQLDSYNVGSDWYFLNVANPVDDPGSLPVGSSADRFVATNNGRDTESLLTVGMTGWVSNTREKAGGFEVDRYGPQQDVEPYDANIGNGVRPDGTFVTGNDPNDVSRRADEQFAKAWVEHLKGQFGSAASDGVKYYALGNEPMLWNSTHRDVHPAPASYQEVRDLGVAYATAIKQVDPEALVMGPVSWGWTAYFYSALDAAGEGNWWEDPQDRNSHGGQAFLPWYLEQMAAAEESAGQRLLDYLDIHYYPQDEGVALTRDGGSLATQQARLRSTRSLWDPTYVDPTWINDTVRLVPRMQEWIDSHYPGTKLAITEYNFGGTNHITGALAQADALGIMGREGVQLATMWDAPGADDASAFAFRMFRNYDGLDSATSRFGETSLSAVTSDVDQVSVFASHREIDDAITVVLVNKSTDSLVTPIQLPTVSSEALVEVYRYSDDDLGRIARDEDVAPSGGELELTLPGYSITLLEIPTSVNTVPLAVDDAYTLSAGTILTVDPAAGVLANDSDAESDQLTATLVEQAQSGFVTLDSSGSFRYEPAEGFQGTDRFIYVARDLAGRSNPATATITVTPAQDVDSMSLVVLDNLRRLHAYDTAGGGLGQVTYEANNRRTRGLAISDDGSTVWTVSLDGRVSVFDGRSQKLGSWRAEGLKYVEGIALDGDDLYLVDRGADRVHIFENATDVRQGSYAATSYWPLAQQNRAPFDLATDGTHVWVINNRATLDQVFVYDLDGTPLGSWTIDPQNKRPTGIALDRNDPNHIWIVDSAADAVFRYEDATLRLDGSQVADRRLSLAGTNRSPHALAYATTPAWAGAAAELNDPEQPTTFDYRLLPQQSVKTISEERQGSNAVSESHGVRSAPSDASRKTPTQTKSYRATERLAAAAVDRILPSKDWLPDLAEFDCLVDSPHDST